MSVNYLIEINALDDWELTHPLSATAYKVMRKLLYLANKERFPERMTVPNGVLMSLVGCSEDSLIKARNQLIQAGLIAYKGQKKLTPLYMLRYFSANPVYNPKLQGYEQGYKQGIKRGYEQGIGPGNEQGTYINKTTPRETDKKPWRSDEDTTTSTNLLAEAQTYGAYTPSLPNGFNQGLLKPISGAGERRKVNLDGKRLDEVLPRRTRELSANERRELFCIQLCADQAGVRDLLGERREVFDRICNSDRFPLEMIGEALMMTDKRNGRYPLDNPIAYLMQLLFDWEERGIKTVDELRDSKDDWWERG